jgi:hypothetical protein
MRTYTAEAAKVEMKIKKPKTKYMILDAGPTVAIGDKTQI